MSVYTAQLVCIMLIGIFKLEVKSLLPSFLFITLLHLKPNCQVIIKIKKNKIIRSLELVLRISESQSSAELWGNLIPLKIKWWSNPAEITALRIYPQI